MFSVSECFSETYAEARAKFCGAAAEAGGALRSWLNAKARGPNGETLYLDTARFGPADAANMLVLIAGTHGVEGHCGSGAEIAWMRSGGPAKLPPGTGALLIHALNPYGFAWTRRVTEDNVDLNRNFVDHDKGYPKNDGYLKIANAVLPVEWSEASSAETDRVFAAYAQKHGAFGLQSAISGGQYTHPDGIFFGGTAPSWSNRTVRAIAREELSQARRVGIIDFHTGLGPFGHGELICAVSPAAKSFAPRQGLVRRRDDLAGRRHVHVGSGRRCHDRRLPAGAAGRRGDAGRTGIRHLYGAGGAERGARRQLAASSRRPRLGAGPRPEGRHEGALLSRPATNGGTWSGPAPTRRSAGR